MNTALLTDETKIALSHQAIAELIASGISQYEANKGEGVRTGHPTHGQVLREHMDRNRLSIRQVADRTGVSDSLVNKLIAGSRSPSLEIISRFRRLFGSAYVDDLLDAVEVIDTASIRSDQGLVYGVYELPDGEWVVHQRTFRRLVDQCKDNNRRKFGRPNENECLASVDAYIQQNVQALGRKIGGEEWRR